MLPCISDNVLVSPHICCTCNQITSESLSALCFGSLADRWTFLMALVFYHPVSPAFTVQYTPKKLQKASPADVWISPILFAEDSGRQSTFILLESLILALKEMKFYGVNCCFGRGVYYAGALTRAVIWVLVIELIFMIIRWHKQDLFMRNIQQSVYASNIQHGDRQEWSSTVSVTQQMIHLFFFASEVFDGGFFFFFFLLVLLSIVPV